jgi:hypothetical protein
MDVRMQFDLRAAGALPIETARSSDLHGLLALSKNLGFSEQAWHSLIDGGAAVCVRDSGKIVGFYVVDHLALISKGERLHELQAAKNVLCNRFKLDESQIAFGAQAAIAAPYSGSPLRAQMLRALLRNVGLRYHHLFTFCGKQNPAELDTLQLEGWRCFQEEDEMCYLMLDVAKALRRLASELVLSTRISRPAAARPVTRSLPGWTSF